MSDKVKHPPYPHCHWPYPVIGYVVPMPPPGYYPPPPGYCAPPPGTYPPPESGAPPGSYPPPGYYDQQGGQRQGANQTAKADNDKPENDMLMQQAEGVVEGLMGEQSNVFKEALSKMGIDDKEFWKGAMIGAAAALILGNENVRNSVIGMFSGAGDMLKTGGGKVKEGATQATQSVKQNVSTGNEIFKDTVSAGKQGFQDSVDRHRAPREEPEVNAEAPTSTEEPSNE